MDERWMFFRGPEVAEIAAAFESMNSEKTVKLVIEYEDDRKEETRTVEAHITSMSRDITPTAFSGQEDAKFGFEGFYEYSEKGKVYLHIFRAAAYDRDTKRGQITDVMRPELDTDPRRASGA